MKKLLVIDGVEYCKKCKKNTCRTRYCWVKRMIDEKHYKPIPETMEELGKLASDLAFEKKCKMRYMAGNDGSFFVCKDGEMYLFEETREMTIDRLYHKLIWVLGDTIWKRKE